MVSEAHGRFSLGLISTGVGAAGLVISLFLWKDVPGTARMLGSFSRSLAGIGGAASLISGISLLQEVGLKLQSVRILRRTHPRLLFIISVLFAVAVVVALVSYTATGNICFRNC